MDDPPPPTPSSIIPSPGHASTGQENERTGKVRPIGLRNLATILLLGTTGQIAWLLENNWFNVFVYDEITTDPAPIAWMVGVSAIVATITTLVMGTVSDRTRGRFGKRKPFIVFGYVIWGIITAIFPLVDWIQDVGIAVVMVVIVDAVMTFFGSTANDAALNAWITDIGHSSNRNRIQSLNSITALLASVVGLGLAGIMIQALGYFIFFYLLGGIVTASGIIAMALIPSPEQVPAPEEVLQGQQRGSIWHEFTTLVDPRVLRENRTLFLLFINMAISGIAAQVYTPYLFIFVENYLGLTKDVLSVYMIFILGITLVVLAIVGMVSHRFNRRTLIVAGTITGGIFMVLAGIVVPSLKAMPEAIPLALGLYVLGMVPGLAAGVAHGGWLQETYPSGNVGKFQGVRMIFMVLLPMVIGPGIGAAVISTFGIPDGTGGFIPTPEIFLAGGVISLFALVPILLINKAEGLVKLDKGNDHGSK
ncbi:MAG: MFS transporter [Candidatus Lokiarchaeota archaeon]|nr:MFS transporter [Candidatus Lokiarchaeota archaeon]